MAANRLIPIPGGKKLAFDASAEAFPNDALAAPLLATATRSQDSTVPGFGVFGVFGGADGGVPVGGDGRSGMALAPPPLAPGLPADGLFASQFYLRNTAVGERDLGLFRGDASVWDDYTGAGVHVGLIDDGIDYLHADLDANYDATLETVDGFHPSASDAQGTAVAGIVAAERNGEGTVGLAYNAAITMMAATGGAPNISIEGAFLNALNFDVVNNSWAYTATWFDQIFNPAQAATYAALDAVSLNGRGGLGTVFVKAAGDGRDAPNGPDNASFSSVNAHFATIAVAAVNRDGTVTTYSTEGASLLVSGFGTPSAGEVVTTDRRGSDGRDAGDYTANFNGTAAAAPMVAGIAALMIEANPGLGYRDVSSILALTARHTGTAIGGGMAGNERYAWEWNQGTHWNGRGMHFSPDYGFGLVDALAAVRLAESWSEQNTRAGLSTRAGGSVTFSDPVPIPDANPSGVQFGFTLAAGLKVEQAELRLGIAHAWTGDLELTLTSPGGTVSQLLHRNGGSLAIPDNGPLDIMLTSNMFLGEDSGGNWTVKIADLAAGRVGTLSKVELLVRGSTSVDDTHVMTEEASAYALAGAMLADTNGGIDTLNASAVFSNSRIDLSGASLSLIDGKSFNTDGSIENAVGGDGNDTLIGTAGSNLLRGFRGADVLDGGAGSDTMIGGLGNDSYTVDVASDDVIESSALAGEIDVVNSAVSWTLGANLENLTLTGVLAINGAGNALANTLIGNDAANTLNGLAGDDTMIGGLGNDVYHVDSALDAAIETSALATESDLVNAAVTWTLGAHLERLTLTGALANAGTGNALDNTINGNAAANVLEGRDGDDTLNGREGADTMVGGLGSDSYYVDSLADQTIETTVLATEVDFVVSSVTWTLGANLERLTLIGALGINGTGNALANRLNGNDAANTLDGGAEDDRLDGGLGNDVLFGGLGGDAMIGGLGNDTYYVDSLADTVSETTALASEIDRVVAGIGYVLGDNLENLTLNGALSIDGTGNALANVLTGNAQANRLEGLGGNDVLNGSTGNDILLGGLGNDTYYVDVAGDAVSETSTLATEIDLVYSAASYTLGANVERLTLTGALAINATGNTLANLLTGNAAANVLNGGTGIDTMIGGLGIDTYYVDVAGDVVSETSTLATENDLVYSAITYTLGANLERLTLTGALALNGTGNTLANTLSGNAGANILNGGAGVDSMVGGLGNDTYYVDVTGDVVSETSALATEIDVVYSTATYTLGANVERLTLTGAGAINATGNTLANILTGNAAANVLNGGAGIDSMIGGLGNDIYYVDSVSDAVTETSALATEIDTMISSVTRTLGANVERLTLTGAAAINATGNTLANILTGNAAANVLNGGAGIDSMIGGLGNDIYYVDSVSDAVTETSALATEIDTMISSVTRTLGANVERLTLTGAVAINATGNTLANILAGNAAANVLNGGAGIDTLVGGLGNDTYYVDVTGDVVSETSALATEIDVVYSTATYTLGANVERLTLTGAVAINATGNTLANILAGNAAANVLNGGAGIDSMIGGLGNDIYYVDSVSDAVTETSALATEIDTVYSTVTRTLGANVENLVLTAAALANGTGNTLANTLTGNTAANTLDGGLGNDVLLGGLGNDILLGGLGNDRLTGGTGLDFFRFTTLRNATTNFDTITDFLSADDRIDLDDAVFAGIGAVGALSAAAFRLGAAALDASDRVIYNQATGRLSYDADGNGAGAAVQFAALNAGTVITLADLFVI